MAILCAASPPSHRQMILGCQSLIGSAVRGVKALVGEALGALAVSLDQLGVGWALGLVGAGLDGGVDAGQVGECC